MIIVGIIAIYDRKLVNVYTYTHTHTHTQRSSSTAQVVIAYVSATFFIISFTLTTIYTVSADLAAIGEDQTPAVGCISLDSLSPSSFRAITFNTGALQPLPGEC